MTALTPLKVLIVEESPNDAELLVQELRSAGFDPDWQLATTEAEYLQRLQSGFNLVLSSYQTPQLSGLRALELLREGGLDVPFIVISNVPGEAAAVTAIKKGANDYLIKNQLRVPWTGCCGPNKPAGSTPSIASPRAARPRSCW